MRVCLVFLILLNMVCDGAAANEGIGEGHFDDGSAKPSGTNTPVEGAGPKKRAPKGQGGKAKKAKSARQRLAMVDGDGGIGGDDMEME